MSEARTMSKYPFHSVLFSVYPIVNLYARNIVFIPFEDTFRFLAISLGFTALFLLLFRFVLKSWGKAGILCSLLVLLFYSFGQIANTIEQWASRRNFDFHVSILAWIWLVIFLLLAFALLRARMPARITQYLNLTALIVILFPTVTILSTATVSGRDGQSEREILAQIRGERDGEASLREVPTSELPDVYYIVFDGYTRGDILREFYGYDNTPFIDALLDRGFYVATSSRSNYMNTTYSLNTSLNLIYFHDFPIQIFRQARYNLRTNYVNDFLRERGYQVVVFDSGTGDTNNQYADFFVSSNAAQSEEFHGPNPFEQLMLRTTMGLLFYERDSYDDNPDRITDVFISSVNRELDVRRERIRHALDHLPDYASREGNYFLFAHLYIPHIPFLFGPDGEELKYHQNLNLYWYEVEPENYIEYYTYQLDHLNQAILSSIDRIMAASDGPIVIILQSDHGDDKFLDWNNPTTQGVNVRTAILNAIFYSDGAYRDLYPTITPVNTFRVTLNHWFGTQYPLLTDRIYFHEHSLSTPFNKKPEFHDGCIELNVCINAEP